MLVVVLAIAAGWSGTARAHRLLPPLAAAALAVVVLVNLVSPPAAASALGPNTGDDLGSELAEAFAGAFTTGVGLHYAPAWGRLAGGDRGGCGSGRHDLAALDARSP